MSDSAFPTTLTKTALFTICAICWALQSLPAVFLYMEGREIVQQRTEAASHLVLPQLLFCNRFPFTQAGLASLGQQFSNTAVLAYLRQWLDPSLGIGPPEDPLAVPLSDQDRQQAEQTIAQLLPNGRLKQRLEQLMPQCQDMVSSCVLGSRQLGGFDCCRMVQPWLATPRGGICWPFVGNLSSVQSQLDTPRGMQITFQISRNSFLSSALTVHPGVDIYLLAPEVHNRLRMATTLDQSLPLNDKRALRMDIHKELHTRSELSCHGSAESVQRSQLVPPASAGLLCMLEKAVDKCSCVPMLVVLWTLQNDLDSSFLRRFNASTICTVGEFDHCVRPYIDFAIGPTTWTSQQIAVPEEASKEFKDSLEECKRASISTCQSARFPARVAERDLPAEYRNTQDFVSRASVAFDSFVVTEVSAAKQMDLYQLLSTLGLNLWWFAIGHLLWSVCHFRCVGSSKVGAASNRVDPKSPLVVPAVSSSATNGPPQRQSSADQQRPQLESSDSAAGQAVPPPGVVRPMGARQLPPLAIQPRQNTSGNGTIGSALEESLEANNNRNEHWEQQ